MTGERTTRGVGLGSELARELEAAPQGAHLCSIHESRDEQLRALVPHLAIGLARGERCLAIVEDPSREDLVAALEGAGMGPQIERGALQIRAVRDTRLCSGVLGPCAIAELFRDASAEAEREGFGGLRIAAEMSWAFEQASHAPRAIELERRSNEPCSTRVDALCQYDARRVPAEILREVLRTHPLAIVGERLCRNFFYEPPEVLLGGRSDGEVVAFRLRKLRESRDVQRELERAEAHLRFLSDVSAALCGSLDPSSMLPAIARRAVPELADWAFLDLYEPDGTLRRVEAVPADATQAALAAELLRSPPRGIPTSTPSVIEALDVAGPCSVCDLRHLDAVPTSKPACSCVAVPLEARGRVRGILKLAYTHASGRCYSASDRPLATELARRAALALETADLYREARAARRKSDEFLAMLGHELRNPLAPIVTALELMEERGADVLVEERRVIDRHVRHLLRLVDDLLDIARITQGRVQLAKSYLELCDVVATAAEMTGPLFEQRSVRLTTRVPRGLVTHADEQRLAQVITNLLVNAAKYTEPGGSVTVSGARGGAEAVVTVTDTGAGIEEELLPHVFDLFVQEPRTLHRSRGGLGLGLAIVKSLVELHGGRVTAESEGVGRGSTFSIRLPLAGPAAGAAPATNDAPAPPVAEPLRVLVVDDNEDAATLLAWALGRRGFDTYAVFDGASALRQAASLRPDVVLLDLGLPGLDGYEVAARLGELSEPRPALIAVTGYGQNGDRARTAAAGFVEHLVKPVELSRVIALLEEIARGRPA